MQIVFVADALESFKIYKDSTFAMMSEAARRGYGVWFTLQEHIERDASGLVCAKVQKLTLTGDALDWYEAAGATWRALREFDAVLMRKDPPFDMEYVYSTYLLEAAEAQGVRVFNRARAIRDHNEKFAITEFPHFTAPTLVTRDPERIRAFHAEHGDIVVKPLDGMGGMGIFRVREDEFNFGSIIETVTALGARSVMVQRYIPEIVDGDKRILIIAGEPVPYSLARVPQGKELRGNLAVGGIGRAQPLSARDAQIANAIGPELAARGLLLVGIDVIGDYLTEINVTSPTCMREITEQSGYPVAGRFVDALEQSLA